MGNFSKDMETLKKGSNRNMVTKMRNAFNELFSRMNPAEEGINKLEERSLEITQTELPWWHSG